MDLFIFLLSLRRVTETGLMDYQRKVWHSPKPRCVKQIHTDDLRVSTKGSLVNTSPEWSDIYYP